MQEVMQVDRLPETVARGLQPCSPEREASRAFGGESALLRAAADEECAVGELRGRAAVAEDEQQRGGQHGRVPTRHVRLVEAGESGAEAGDIKNEGEAK